MESSEIQQYLDLFLLLCAGFFLNVLNLYAQIELSFLEYLKITWYYLVLVLHADDVLYMNA